MKLRLRTIHTIRNWLLSCSPDKVRDSPREAEREHNHRAQELVHLTISRSRCAPRKKPTLATVVPLPRSVAYSVTAS